MHRNLSDLEVVAAIREGDKAVFQHVFDSTYESLCQYAFTILKNMDEAEDMVQSVFIKMWEKRETLDVKYAMKSYLFKAVYNQSINEIEHRTVVVKHQAYDKRIRTDEVQPDVFPEELEDNIKLAIEGLPPQCRAIFIMSRYEELPYARIATKLNISVNTVENQISKALRILRLELKDLIV
jgi:RNA polymerase sigma-70 factor (ECF subfamily)